MYKLEMNFSTDGVPNLTYSEKCLNPSGNILPKFIAVSIISFSTKIKLEAIFPFCFIISVLIFKWRLNYTLCYIIFNMYKT